MGQFHDRPTDVVNPHISPGASIANPPPVRLCGICFFSKLIGYQYQKKLPAPCNRQTFRPKKLKNQKILKKIIIGLLENFWAKKAAGYRGLAICSDIGTL